MLANIFVGNVEEGDVKGQLGGPDRNAEILLHNKSNPDSATGPDPVIRD